MATALLPTITTENCVIGRLTYIFIVIDAVNMKMILTFYNITSNTRIYIYQYDFNIVVFNPKNKINGQPFDL